MHRDQCTVFDFRRKKREIGGITPLAFYVGSILIIGTLIGLWTRWCLGNRDPWLWVVYRILEGKKKWTRPALLSYWALLGSLSVAGWNRQLARAASLPAKKFDPSYRRYTRKQLHNGECATVEPRVMVGRPHRRWRPRLALGHGFSYVVSQHA